MTSTVKDVVILARSQLLLVPHLLHLQISLLICLPLFHLAPSLMNGRVSAR